MRKVCSWCDHWNGRLYKHKRPFGYMHSGCYAVVKKLFYVRRKGVPMRMISLGIEAKD